MDVLTAIEGRRSIRRFEETEVPDDRLGWLSELDGSKKITPAEVELLDVPGLNLQIGR